MIEQLDSIPSGQTWGDYIACSEADPAAFFPAKGAPHAVAAECCQECQVQKFCLQDGFDSHDRLGFRAGKSMATWRRLGHEAAFASLEKRLNSAG